MYLTELELCMTFLYPYHNCIAFIHSADCLAFVGFLELSGISSISRNKLNKTFGENRRANEPGILTDPTPWIVWLASVK